MNKYLFLRALSTTALELKAPKPEKQSNPDMSLTKKIKLSEIHIDGGTQPRSEIDEQIVSEYAEEMREGDEFPPVTVFQDGLKYWLADGFHRYHASNRLGFLEIEAEVHSGTKRDAILYSASANAKHGLRRTNADKRKAVLTLLNDEEWSQWSDREIARRCEVSPKTVSKYRDDASVEIPQIERKVKRGDQEYTVNTSNIGSKKKLLDDPSDHDEEEDTGYDFPDSVQSEADKLIERKGIGLQKAHEAIAKLKQIPLNDGLLQEAYDTVIQWINHNR